MRNWNQNRNWNWNREFETNRETQNSVGLRATRSNAFKVLNSGPVSCGEWNRKLSRPPAAIITVVWGGRSQQIWKRASMGRERARVLRAATACSQRERSHKPGARASFVKAFLLAALGSRVSVCMCRCVCVCFSLRAALRSLSLSHTLVLFLAAPILNSCFLFLFLRPACCSTLLTIETQKRVGDGKEREGERERLCFYK